jgi:hypothetical protein
MLMTLLLVLPLLLSASPEAWSFPQRRRLAAAAAPRRWRKRKKLLGLAVEVAGVHGVAQGVVVQAAPQVHLGAVLAAAAAAVSTTVSTAVSTAVGRASVSAAVGVTARVVVAG